MLLRIYNFIGGQECSVPPFVDVNLQQIPLTPLGILGGCNSNLAYAFILHKMYQLRVTRLSPPPPKRNM